VAKKSKRFWVGDPDGFGLPDEDQVEGSLTPDDDGCVYLNRRRPADKEAKDGKSRNTTTPQERERPVVDRNARRRR
jgi:hypothetical protein